MADRDDSTGAVLRRGAAALVGANVANVAVAAVADAIALAPGFRPLALPPVAFLTTLGAVGATGTYLAVARFADDPDHVFTVVAALVLLLSFVPDVGLLLGDPAATLPGVLTLMLMHVLAAAACVAALTGRVAALEERLG